MTSIASSSSSPPALSPAGPKRQQRGIQLPQLLLSLLVVGVFALLAVWWQASTTSRSPVLALAQDIQVGEPVRAEDLTEVYISTDVPSAVVSADRRLDFVGALPVLDLPAGTLINSDMFLRGSTLDEGQAFVGLVLSGTEAPGGLTAGDRVQVLSAADKAEPQILAPDAQVENASYQSGQLSVRLRLGLTSAQLIQVNANSVVLIEIENTGPASWEQEDPS